MIRFASFVMAFLSVSWYGFAASSPEWEARTALAQQLDVGESAPDWLVDSESYIIGFQPGDWSLLAESKVAFITHCPVNRDFFTRCHALGIRCFPYVTFYQGFATMTYQGLNLKDHPEFIEVNAEGNLVRTGFWVSEDAKNMYTTCPNMQAYQDAMAAWVEKVMEQGADGVFVDNLSSRAACAGPQFGKHQHLYEDQNHAFAMLLKRVREIVKQHQPEGAVLGNSASPQTLPKEFWKYLDAEMLESYICTWVSTERWFDWTSHWNKVGKDLQPFVKAGKQIQALSYLGHTPYGIREDALFCYASARLAGFVWSGGTVNDETADLYRLRLGKPLTDETEKDGLHYRVFERGLIAVNPDKQKGARLALGPDIPAKRFYELATDNARGWDRYLDAGYAVDHAAAHDGTRGIRVTNHGVTQGGGASQGIALKQTEAKSLVVSGWSKAEEISGAPDANYALYVDINYADGSNLFGQSHPFETGTHDWQFISYEIKPEKPVQSLTLYALCRYKTGQAWFDGLSLSEKGGANLVQNGAFEESSRTGRIIDAGSAGALELPPFAGRVYLFQPDTGNDLGVSGPRLTVVTSPALGEVRFRVDGFDYWTYSGRWTTEYVLGPMFGKFDIQFDAPGKHTIEVVDVVPADMSTPAGYGSGERLGQFMDPSNPTQPSQGKKFRFRAWEGHGDNPVLEIEVNQDATITASFDVGEGKP
jgi:hypothetical protein